MVLGTTALRGQRRDQVTGPDPGLLTLVCSIGQLTDEPLKPVFHIGTIGKYRKDLLQ